MANAGQTFPDRRAGRSAKAVVQACAGENVWQQRAMRCDRRSGPGNLMPADMFRDSSVTIS
jgi:hypothetical protein